MTTNKATYHLQEGFTTSINAVKSVMNVPVGTIINELNKNNYSVNDTSSNCIDEKMLERFAEIYKKRLKKYFISCVENLDSLTKEEYKDFVDFSESFSKDGSLTFNWRKIDKDSIKETFFQEIAKYEYSAHNAIDITSILASSVSVSRRVESRLVFDVPTLVSNFIDKFLDYYFEPNVNEKDLQSIENRDDRRIVTLKKIKKSRFYRSRLKKRIPHLNKSIKQQRKFYACLQLYIVPDDGNTEDLSFKKAV